MDIVGRTGLLVFVGQALLPVLAESRPVSPPGGTWRLSFSLRWVQQAHVIGSPTTSLMLAKLAGTGLLSSTDHPHASKTFFQPLNPSPDLRGLECPFPPILSSSCCDPLCLFWQPHLKPPWNSPLRVPTPEAEVLGSSESRRTRVRLGQPGGLRENGTGSSLPQSHPGDVGAS